MWINSAETETDSSKQPHSFTADEIFYDFQNWRNLLSFRSAYRGSKSCDEQRAKTENQSAYHGIDLTGLVGLG